MLVCIDASCARRILDNLTLQKLQNSANFSGSEAPKLQELVTSDPRITQYSSEQIEETWQRWPEKGKQVRVGFERKGCEGLMLI